MSYTDVGKDAKRMGRVHPRDARKADPEPPRVTPKANKGTKVRKRYGYSYQRRSRYQPNAKWKRVEHWTWYETEKQRDQAMQAAGGFMRGIYEVRNPHPITRS